MSGTRVPSFVLGVLLTSAVESGVTGTRRDTCSADPGLRLVTGSTEADNHSWWRTAFALESLLRCGIMSKGRRVGAQKIGPDQLRLT